jgi:fructose-bisphosphate aldolase class I
MEGTHSLEDCKIVQSRVLSELFKTFEEYEIWLPGIILNINFVSPGIEYFNTHTTHSGKEFTDFSGFDKESYDVCNTTLDILSTHVSQAIGAVFFLNGELSEKSSINLLKKINQLKEERSISKKNQVIQYLSFSYDHTLQYSALKVWSGKFENLVKAQQTFLEKCKQNSEAIIKNQ